MKKFGTIILVIMASLVLSVNVFAQSSGKEGKFTIHNQSDKNVVVGFYTNDGDGWSDNWLADNLAPGAAAEAEFTADTGSCAQTLQVGWLGSEGGEVLDDPIDINICDASNVYAADNEIYYD